MKPVEATIKPTQNWNHLVAVGLVDDRTFRYIHSRFSGISGVFAEFAAMRRAIADRNKIERAMDCLLQAGHSTEISTPCYRRVIQDFLQQVKGLR